MKFPQLLPGTSPVCLKANPFPQIRRLVVTETDVEVVISGTVPSYYMKQLAQEAVRPALGCRRLLNQVEVSRAG